MNQFGDKQKVTIPTHPEREGKRETKQAAGQQSSLASALLDEVHAPRAPKLRPTKDFPSDLCVQAMFVMFPISAALREKSYTTSPPPHSPELIHSLE